MATSRGLGQFSRRMRVVGDLFASNLEKNIRKAVLAGDQVAVLATPVDSGRARAGWFVSVGFPSDDTAEPDSPGGSAAQSIGRALGAVAGWKIGSGPIFITNNVEYIVPLDNGSSSQAPAGMSAAAVLTINSVIRGSRNLPRG